MEMETISMRLEQVLADLDQDPIRNINLMNFLRQYPLVSIDQVGRSYLIRGTSDHTWVYISSTEPTEFAELMRLLHEEDEYYAIIEDWMLPALLQGKEMIWQLTCMKLFFPNEIPLPMPKDHIVKLSKECAEYIFAHSKYKDFTSIEYITERIEIGHALGVFEEGRLVAWVMTHDDGAMGFLHVLPECRGKGYANDLSYELIRRLREEGQIPFVHIEESNVPSMTLARKIGFLPDRRIHWFQRSR